MLPFLAAGLAENGDVLAADPAADVLVEAPGTPSATATVRGPDGLMSSASPAKSAAVLEARVAELEVRCVPYCLFLCVLSSK